MRKRLLFVPEGEEGKGRGGLEFCLVFGFCARLHSSDSTQRSNANVRIYSATLRQDPALFGCLRRRVCFAQSVTKKWRAEVSSV